MDFWTNYQAKARSTAIYPNQGNNLLYPIMGLGNEMGELMTPIKKAHRSGMTEVDNKKRQQIIDEAGDVLWYCSQLLSEMEASMSDAVSVADADTVVSANSETTTQVEFLELVVLRLMMLSGILSTDYLDSGSDYLYHDVVDILSALLYILYKIGSNLEEVAEANLSKLFARKEAGVIEGDGSIADRLAAKLMSM